MIGYFYVSYFKSFRDGFVYCYDESYHHDGDNTMSMVVGRNNAGKSNFVDAFDTLKKLVLRGITIKDLKEVRNRDCDNSDPLVFEIGFTTDVEGNKREYNYSISIDSESHVTSETLYVIDGEETINLIETVGTKRLLHSMRPGKSIATECPEKSIFSYLLSDRPGFDKPHIDHFHQLCKSDSDFISIFNHIIPFLTFFRNMAIIRPSNGYIGPYNSERLNQLFKYFDIGVEMRSTVETDPDILNAIESHIRQTKDPIEYQSLKHGFGKIMRTVIGSRSYSVDYTTPNPVVSSIELNRNGKWVCVSEESLSEGIYRFLNLYSIVTENIKGMVYIVDELDRKIHTNLTLKLIELFLLEKNDVQLIFTTHESELLNSEYVDVKNLWIVDKEEGIGSELKPCPPVRPEFNIRDLYIEDKLT